MKHVPRFRLWFLGAVNVLILLHVVSYYVLDLKGIGCVDFFGLATFLGKGEITAGTVLLGLLILSTLAVGRIFCGWGCHFALFQDLLMRGLNRVGLSPPFRRSRLELVLPPLLFFVTLLYPILAWWRDRGVPRDVTMNLAYPEVWHLLPGLKGVLLILAVDVVVLTVLFGSRAFCRYLCPYGLFLKFFHVLSPTRIVKAGDCSNCGACTSVCPTGVSIKYEIEKLGVVHDLNCMNCGDCVAVCPEGALALKPTKKAYSRTLDRIATGSSQPVWAEGILLVTAVAGLLLYRGREYGDFLSIAMGISAGATVVVAVEPRRFVRARWAARCSSRTLRSGAAALAGYLLLGLVGQGLSVHALSRGQQAVDAGNFEIAWRAYARGEQLASFLYPFTFYLDHFRDRAARDGDGIFAKANDRMESSAWREAEWAYRTVLVCQPERVQAHGNLATARLRQGRFWEAAQGYLKVLEHDPNDLVALYHLAVTRIQIGQLDEAAGIVGKMLAIDGVGNAYDLIQQNAVFKLLEPHPEYRSAMSQYRFQRAKRSLETREAAR